MAETRFKLSSCCGFYPLQFGTVFVGIATIVSSIITMVLIWTLDISKWKGNFLYFIDLETLKVIYSINLVMTCLVTIVMITGAITRRTTMMFPWIILGLILIITFFVAVIVTSISLFLNDDEYNHIELGFLYLFIGVIIDSFYGYFWFVVYSYFQQLRHEKATMKVGPYGRPYTYQRP